jgi:hypothetical protein
MIVVVGIKIPPIDEVSEDELRDILDEIIKFAKSNPQGPERETFDFKRQLDINNTDEIRKDFSSFANARGGLIVVGLDEKKDYQVINLQNIPKDEQLAQILSTDNYIYPSMRPCSRAIAYQGKTVLLYYISERREPIGVKRHGQWVVYSRNNNTTKTLSPIEITLKFYSGVKKLHEHARINTSQLSFYSSKDDSREPSIKLTIKNQGELYKWLKLMRTPLIPIPLPVMPSQYHSEVYYSSTSWHGNYEKLLNIIESIEDTLQEFGISFEVWTVPLGGAKTYSEDHHYIIGCGAQNLKTCLEKVCKNQPVTRFGWILFSPVTVLVIGELYENHCDIEVQSIFSFIPNNYPFISIDDAGRVIPEPLPAYKMDWWTEDYVTECRSKSSLPWAEDLSDELLASAPSAQVKGYLGDKPRPRSYNFRAKGLTLLEVTGPTDKFPEDAPLLISNVAPIFCSISSAPTGLNDLKEVKIGGMKLSTLSIPHRDLTLILFSIDCYVNQSKSYRMVMEK